MVTFVGTEGVATASRGGIFASGAQIRVCAEIIAPP